MYVQQLENIFLQNLIREEKNFSTEQCLISQRNLKTYRKVLIEILEQIMKTGTVKTDSFKAMKVTEKNKYLPILKIVAEKYIAEFHGRLNMSHIIKLKRNLGFKNTKNCIDVPEAIELVKKVKNYKEVAQNYDISEHALRSLIWRWSNKQNLLKIEDTEVDNRDEISYFTEEEGRGDKEDLSINDEFNGRKKIKFEKTEEDNVNMANFNNIHEEFKAIVLTENATQDNLCCTELQKINETLREKIQILSQKIRDLELCNTNLSGKIIALDIQIHTLKVELRNVQDILAEKEESLRKEHLNFEEKKWQTNLSQLEVFISGINGIWKTLDKRKDEITGKYVPKDENYNCLEVPKVRIERLLFEKAKIVQQNLDLRIINKRLQITESKLENTMQSLYRSIFTAYEKGYEVSEKKALNLIREELAKHLQEVYASQNILNIRIPPENKIYRKLQQKADLIISQKKLTNDYLKFFHDLVAEICRKDFEFWQSVKSVFSKKYLKNGFATISTLLPQHTKALSIMLEKQELICSKSDFSAQEALLYVISALKELMADYKTLEFEIVSHRRRIGFKKVHSFLNDHLFPIRELTHLFGQLLFEKVTIIRKFYSEKRIPRELEPYVLPNDLDPHEIWINSETLKSYFAVRKKNLKPYNPDYFNKRLLAISRNFIIEPEIKVIIID